MRWPGIAAAVVACAAAAGCGGDDSCGPAGAPADGLVVTVPDPGPGMTGGAAVEVAYGGFTSSANNDCTPPGQELTSLTLDGVQTDPAPSRDFALAFCLPRPDRLGGAVALDDAGLVQLIDLNAEIDGCAVTLDRSAAPTGTIEFVGYCGDGSDPAGYAIRLDGTAPGLLLCPGDPEPAPLTLELAGEVAVEALVF